MATMQEMAREFWTIFCKTNNFMPNEGWLVADSMAWRFAEAFHAYMLEQAAKEEMNGIRRGLGMKPLAEPAVKPEPEAAYDGPYFFTEPAAQPSATNLMHRPKCCDNGYFGESHDCQKTPSATHREPVDKFSGLPSVVRMEEGAEGGSAMGSHFRPSATPVKQGIHIDTEYFNEPKSADKPGCPRYSGAGECDCDTNEPGAYTADRCHVCDELVSECKCAPAPSAREAQAGEKGWVSEPDWPTESRNASYRAGMRDAQKAFEVWKGKVIDYESVRRPAPQVAGLSAMCSECDRSPLSFRVHMDNSMAVVCTNCQYEFKHWPTLHEVELSELEQFFHGAPAAHDVRKLIELCWTAVSKLESQVSRNQGLPPVYKSIVTEAFDALRKLEKIGAPAEPQRWRETAEDMPNQGQWCWVKIDKVVQRHPARLSGRMWEWMDDAADYAPLEVVSHYCPLPEPPKERP